MSTQFGVQVVVQVTGDKPAVLHGAPVVLQGEPTAEGIIAALQEQAPMLVELYQAHYGAP